MSPNVVDIPGTANRRRPLRATLPTFDLNPLRSALDAIPVVAWVTNPELRVVHAFGKALRSVGAVPERMAGQPLAEAFACGPDNEIVRGTAAALTGEHRQFECVWADRMYDAEVQPIVDAAGKITGAFGVALDVTERNENAARLRRLAALLDAADDAIIAASGDGRIRTWNRGAEKLFGAPLQAVADHSLADFFLEQEQLSARIERVLAGEPLLALDMVLTPRADPQPRYVSVSMSPIKNGVGRTVGLTAIVRNHTERRLVEPQGHMAPEVEALGRFAGDVAQEFDNLLTVIQVYGELLASQLPPHWPAQEDLAVMMQATRSAADLTRHLLAVARGEDSPAPPS